MKTNSLIIMNFEEHYYFSVSSINFSIEKLVCKTSIFNIDTREKEDGLMILKFTSPHSIFKYQSSKFLEIVFGSKR